MLFDLVKSWYFSFPQKEVDKLGLARAVRIEAGPGWFLTHT